MSVKIYKNKKWIECAAAQDMSKYYTAEECDNRFFLESAGVELDTRVHTIEDNYVAKTSEKNKVYGTDGNGTRYLFPINVDPVAYTIAYRNGNGQINVSAPTTETNAVNLKYFNEHLPSTAIYHIELSGTSGTLTDEQRTTLLSGTPTNNYILYGGNVYLKCVYYVENSRAIYSVAGSDNNTAVDITLPAGTWTYTNVNFASVTYVDTKVSTEATTRENADKQLQSNIDACVKKTGDETITGIKNFATNLQVASHNVATEDQVSARELLTNKTTTISESSTDTQYPSAKAVYTYIQSLNANETKY